MTDNIKLPAFPDESVLMRVMPGDYRYGEVRGYTIGQMAAYARAAVLADRERMKDKVDALRLDAGRYRWLRNNANSDEGGLCAVRIERWSYGEAMLDILVRHELDETIDNARKGGSQ